MKTSTTVVLQLWIIIALLLAALVTVIRRGDSCSRYHYRTKSGEMFDGKTGDVIDVESGRVKFQVGSRRK